MRTKQKADCFWKWNMLLFLGLVAHKRSERGLKMIPSGSPLCSTGVLRQTRWTVEMLGLRWTGALLGLCRIRETVPSKILIFQVIWEKCERKILYRLWYIHHWQSCLQKAKLLDFQQFMWLQLLDGGDWCDWSDWGNFSATHTVNMKNNTINCFFLAHLAATQHLFSCVHVSTNHTSTFQTQSEHLQADTSSFGISQL